MGYIKKIIKYLGPFLVVITALVVIGRLMQDEKKDGPLGEESVRKKKDIRIQYTSEDREKISNDWKKINENYQPPPTIKKNLMRLEMTGECWGCDLKGADMRGFSTYFFGTCRRKNKVLYVPCARYVGLMHANLSNTNFSGVHMGAFVFYGPDADLSGANLTNTDMTFANLKESILIKANLTKAKLTGSNLYKAKMTDANLTKAVLDGANLNNTNLSNANLSDTSLKRAYMSMTNLTNANLSGADLRHADFNNVDVVSADLSGANLRGATFVRTDFSNSNLSGADFRNALQWGDDMCIENPYDARSGEEPDYRKKKWKGHCPTEGRVPLNEYVVFNSEEYLHTSEHFARTYDQCAEGYTNPDLHKKFVDESGETHWCEFMDANKNDKTSAICKREMHLDCGGKGLNLSWTKLKGANFSGFDFSAVDLTNADLTQAIMKNSRGLDRAILCKTILPWGEENRDCK